MTKMYRLSGLPTIDRALGASIRSQALIKEHLHDMRTEMWCLLERKKRGGIPETPPMRTFVQKRVNFALMARSYRPAIFYLRDGEEVVVSWSQNDEVDAHGRPY